LSDLAESSGPQPLSLNIMVVEDSHEQVLLLVRFLEKMGHRVVYVAETGEDALRHYPIFCPDLITMDISIPRISGLETTVELLRRHPEAWILMLTANGQEKVVVEAMKAGVKGFLLKPFDQKRLSEAIHRIFNRLV